MSDDQSSNENIESEKKLALATEVMLKKLEMQQFGHDSIEGKVGVLLGFVATILTILLGFVFAHDTLFGLNIFTLGLFGCFLTLIYLSLASKTRIYFDPPDFDRFYSEAAFAETSLDIRNGVVADMKESYIRNAKNQDVKSAFYNYALLTLLISLALILLGILEIQQ